MDLNFYFSVIQIEIIIIEILYIYINESRVYQYIISVQIANIANDPMSETSSRYTYVVREIKTRHYYSNVLTLNFVHFHAFQNIGSFAMFAKIDRESEYLGVDM